MDQFPYYKTWARQTDLDAFAVATAEHDEFVMQDGRRVYDFLSTSFQTSFGHSHPLIRDRIHQQLDAMPITSPKASFELKHRVSHRLLERLGLPAGKLFYTSGGSESVENALKMARQIRGATKVLARQKSYHGATLGALSVTGDWRNDPHWTLDSETVRIPEPADDPDFAEATRRLHAAGADSVAAVILETVSGTNGVAIPEPEYLHNAQAVCRETGVMLIIDEVLCGFGRCGGDFAFQAYGVEPDLVCLSKGITGGYIPFGAVYTAPRIVDFYERETLACGLTTYAHPLGLAALDAVLDLLADDDFLANRRAAEQALREELDAWAEEPWVEAVRCRGLLAAIELSYPAPTWQMCFDAGLHLFAKANMLVIAPPLVSTPERLRAAVGTLREVSASAVAAPV